MEDVRFVTNVVGTFSFLFFFGLGGQIARVWKATGRFPIVAAPHGLISLALPVAMFAYALKPLLYGPPIALFWSLPVRLLGLAALCLGTSVVGISFQEMGSAWRIGIDDAQRTQMVSRGIYSRVRHPIYSGVMAICGGLFLVTASPGFLLAFCISVAAAILQSRAEERYLTETFGDAYKEYMASTGRFLPRLG